MPKVNLVKAIKSGNYKVADQLIKDGADINAVDRNGQSAIHLAASHSNVALVKLLIAEGANVNQPEDNAIRCRPLHCAFKGNSIEVAKLLIDAGADLENKNSFGDTVLHFAVSFSGREELVMFLLKCGSNVNAKSNAGWTALHYALRSNRNNSHLAIIKLLLEGGADSNYLNNKGFSPLHMTLRDDNRAMVNLLREYGGDISKENSQGETALHLAARNKDPEVFKWIFESTAEIDKKSDSGETALHTATIAQRPEYVRQLVARGADVNAKDYHGATPLYCCINDDYFFIERKLEMIQLLLELGSDLNPKVTPDAMTIFKIVMEEDSFEEYKILVKHAAIVEARTDKQLIDAFNLMMINGEPKYKFYYEECQAELKAMKSRKIGDTLISYFSLLAMPLKVVAGFARNEELVQAFESSDYEVAFPIYGKQLRLKLDEGIDGQKRFEKAVTILSRTLPFADPSHPAYYIILSCLTREEVDVIINAD